MTPKQREFLGIACTERVEHLLAQLETLSRKEVLFDRDIVAKPGLGLSKGEYHCGGSAPRISLLEGTIEIIAAHELLHGILEYEDYPVNLDLDKLLPFVTEVASEVTQCAQHVVIDQRLHAMGYDIPAHRLETAQTRAAGLAAARPSINDLQSEQLWCVRAACAIACYAAYPNDNVDFHDPFAARARELLPGCMGLAEKFSSIVLAMRADDPRDVQLSVRRMLAAVEAEYGAFPYCAILQRFTAFSPLFVTREQLTAPAGRSVRFDVAVWLNNAGQKKGTIAVISEKSSGTTWAIATSESIDAQRIMRALENLMTEPLEKFFRDYKVRYVER